jgi:hypothetical protein
VEKVAMLTVQKSYGIVQRILTRLTSLKMANLQRPGQAPALQTVERYHCQQ